MAVGLSWGIECLEELECSLSGVYYNGNWATYFTEWCTIIVYSVLILMLKLEASNLLWLLAFGTQIPWRVFQWQMILVGLAHFIFVMIWLAHHMRALR